MRRLTVLSSVLFFVSVFLFLEIAANSQDPTPRHFLLDRANVEMRPRGAVTRKRSVVLERDWFSFSPKTVTIREGDSISELLRANGIEPGPDSYTFLYDLNPGLVNVHLVNVGDAIKLPQFKVLPSASVPKSMRFSSQRQVAFSLSYDLKAPLRARTVAFEGLDEELSRLGPDRFERHVDSSVFVQSAQNTRKTLAVLQSNGFAVSSEMLSQVEGETALLESISYKTHLVGAKLSAADSDDARAIGINMQARLDALVNGQAGNVVVVVRTVKEGHDVNDLTVHYASVALFRDPKYHQEFGKASSPTDAPMPVADYRLWATRPGDDKPITEVKTIKVRPDNKEFDLTIVK